MLAELKPHLDERQWRLTPGAQARALGRLGISRVAALTRSHPDTVSRGARELEQGIEPGGRVRQAGAGRPSATDLYPGLGGCAAQAGGAGDARGPDAAAGVDDQVDREPGR